MDGRQARAEAHRQVCRIGRRAPAVLRRQSECARVTFQGCRWRNHSPQVGGLGRFRWKLQGGARMRRGKRALRAMAGIWHRDVGGRLGDHGSTDGRPGGRRDGIRRPGSQGEAAHRARARVCGHAARVRQEPGPDRCARALLRARQPLRVLRDPRRADALADEGQAATQLALALRFVGHNRAAAPAGTKRAPGKVNYLRGKTRASGRRSSLAIRTSSIAISGRTSTCACTRRPAR